MENNHKNIIAAGIVPIAFIITFLVSGDILKSLVSGILIAIITEIVISKHKDAEENHHLRAVETKTKSEHSENSTKIINWKAILIGLIISVVLSVILLTTPPSDGATELSEEASILLTLSVMGSVFMGGAVTGYMSGSGKRGLVNSVIFAVILGFLMMLLDPLMLIFVIPGPIGGIIGGAVGKVLKNN
ncbi:MAG: hypothetical protein ABFC34_10470 [Methanobacterium sp.]